MPKICIVFDEKLLDIPNPEIALSLFARGRTRIVVYLREPVAHIASRYADRAKAKNPTASFQESAKSPAGWT